MNKFSIIVPVYNGEKFLDKCIKSLLEQTYQNIELIIIDDGSTDNSYEKVQEFASKDERIIVLKQQNQGVSCARNIGIKNATGNYITFVDSDDYLEKDAIETLAKNLQDDCQLVVAEIASIEKNKKSIRKCPMVGQYKIKEMFYKLLKKRQYIERINSVCSKGYKLEIIKNNQIKFDEDIQIGEDLLFNIQYLKNVQNIIWVKDIIYNYNKDNNNSSTKKYNENKYEQLKKVNQQFTKLLLMFEDISLLKISKYIKLKNIYSCILDLEHSEYKNKLKDKIKFIKQIKSDNKKIIITKMGIYPYILSILYSNSSIRILLVFCRIISRIRKKKNKMNTVFVKAYLRKNLGDDLFVKILSQRYHNINFKSISSYNYKYVFDRNVKIYGGKIINLINKCIQLVTFKRYSLINLGSNLSNATVWIGGSVFMENGINPISSIKISPQKKYYILGCNFGPYKTEKYFEQAKATFINAQDVCFREKYSYNLFSNITNVRVAPDIVFGMDTSKIMIKKTKKVIISVINCKKRFSKQISEKYEKAIIKLIFFFIQKGYEITLMSFCQVEGDEKAIKSILKKNNLNENKYITTYFYKGNIEETLNVMADSSIVIGSRFHANIIGLLLGKTVIPIAYSNKTINFLEDINFRGIYIKINEIEKFKLEQLTDDKLNYIHKVDELRKNAIQHFEKLDKFL